jgi:hypothetical protein
MSSFLIIIGFMLAFSGIIFGPYILNEKVHNHMDAKAAGFLCMLPGLLLLCCGFYLK